MKSSLRVIVAAAEPTPRPGIFDLYWTFASRRQAAFEQRLLGVPPPWSKDPILQTFKFCNVYRAADRVSQYLIAQVIYQRNAGTLEDRVFQIVAFRMFSNIQTWESLRSILGAAPTIKHLKSGAFEHAVKTTLHLNGRLYTGAFILCANKVYGFEEKYRNHVALFQEMFNHGALPRAVEAANGLEDVVRALEKYPLIGPFMAYQIAIDLNYSELINFNENEFTQAGPGALRGIKKAFLDTGDLSPTEIIQWMVERQAREFGTRGLPFNGLFGRPLHAIDCQGLFCELDKYCREAAPELISARQRIKARFSPSSEPLPVFLPPKWGLVIPKYETRPTTLIAQYRLFGTDGCGFPLMSSVSAAKPIKAKRVSLDKVSGRHWKPKTVRKGKRKRA